MIGVLLFLTGIFLFMGIFLFVLMKSIKTEQAFMSHLKSDYPALYDSNPYALGGAKDYMVLRKRTLRVVLFTRAKSNEAKAEYKIAKQDKLIRRLKVEAWVLLIAGLIIIPISFVMFLLNLGFLTN